MNLDDLRAIFRNVWSFISSHKCRRDLKKKKKLKQQLNFVQSLWDHLGSTRTKQTASTPASQKTVLVKFGELAVRKSSLCWISLWTFQKWWWWWSNNHWSQRTHRHQQNHHWTIQSQHEKESLAKLLMLLNHQFLFYSSYFLF